jgi:hypothetical protein
MQDLEIIEKSIIIFQSIKNDLENLKKLEPEEIDFSDKIDELRSIVIFFIDNRLRLKNNEILKKILLAYSLEIARRPMTSYWDTFFTDLSREYDQSTYKFVLDSDCDCLTSLNCPPYTDYSGRHLVSSLLHQTKSDPEFISNMLEFFVFHYKNFKDQDLKTSLNLYPSCQKYLGNKEHQDFIIRSVNRLITATDDILETYSDQLENDDFLKHFFKQRYNIHTSWFSRKKISTIFKELINTITPPQFLKILKNNRESFVIHPEKGKIPVRQIESQVIDYGKYSLNNEAFTVTPHFRISINDMKNWSNEVVREFKGITYYKKDKIFYVSLPPVRKLCDGTVKCYLWCGALPIGKEIIIDDKKRRREGLSWNPKLKVQLIDFKIPPTLAIEFGNIIGYFREFANKDLILTCGSYSKRVLINFNGVVSDENPHVLISGTETEIIVSCNIAGLLKKQSKIELDNHLLFSSSSREQIKNLLDYSNVVKRQFGENRYYLFSTIKPGEIQLSEQKNIRINSLNNVFGKYNIYEVIWETASQFQLTIQEFVWKFENKKYIQILFFNNQGIFETVSEMQVYIESNLQDVEAELYCKIFNCNYEQIANRIEIEKTAFINNRLTLSGSVIQESLEGNLFPGLYVIEIRSGELHDERPFYIVPQTEIKWPDLLVEGEKSNVEIISEGQYLNDVQKNIATNKITTEIIGRVLEYGKDEKKIRPDPVIIKFSYIDPPRVVEKSPEMPIFVFGYRLYRRFIEDSKQYLSHVYELNYYDLFESQLLIFSRPQDTFEILINDVKVSSGIFDQDGLSLNKNLENFAQYCDRSMNEVKIITQNTSKKFQIIWYPRINSLDVPLEISSDTISGIIGFEGPEGSSISVELKTPISLLDTQKFSCYNDEGIKEIMFDVKKSINSYFFYLIVSSSIDGKSFIPSLSKTICNTQAFFIKITVLDNKKSEVNLSLKNMYKGIKTYLEKITSFQKPILFQVYAKSRDNSVLLQLLQLLTENTQDYQIFYDVKNESVIINSVQKMDKTALFSSLIDQQGDLVSKSVEKILDPFTHNEIIKQGLGISSKKIYDNLESYLPKPNLIIFFNLPKYRPLIEKTLIQKYRDRTFIFLESDNIK